MGEFLKKWEAKAQAGWHPPTKKEQSKALSPYDMIGTKNWQKKIPQQEKQAEFAKKWQDKAQKAWEARKAKIKKAAKKAAKVQQEGMMETPHEEKLPWQQRWAQAKFADDWQNKAIHRWKEFHAERKFDHQAEQSSQDLEDDEDFGEPTEEFEEEDEPADQEIDDY